jgi:single-stranded-DNA-specific exonuclease
LKFYRWNILEDPDDARLYDSNKLSIAKRVVRARNYDEASLDEFERPVLHDPFLLKDMQKAVLSVTGAIENNKLICVYGDYDCDGIAATAMLVDYFEHVGARVCYYIPHRIDEGYGLNIDAVEQLHRLGVGLIITVDNGISSLKEIEAANLLGMQVVITDHHTPPECLPAAAAILNPHQAGCGYPFKVLSGVGVAFKLLCGLEGETGYGLLEQYADFLAIGTVADVVPLIGENRLFVKSGLELMRLEARPGIKEMMLRAGVKFENLSSETISFVLAPRLNAAGRLGQADLSVMLLVSQDCDNASDLAQQLEEINSKRKDIEADVLNEVLKYLLKNPLVQMKKIIVCCGQGWNTGVLGIVCSRISQRYGKPVILLSQNEGVATGSGRSVEGFSLIDAVAACRDYLVRFGGHPMAAGLTVSADAVGDFAKAINHYADTNYPKMPTPSLNIDCVLSEHYMDYQQVLSLESLEPFGNGNSVPVFAVFDAKVTSIESLSDNRHIRLGFELGTKRFSGLLFFTNMQRISIDAGDVADLAFTLAPNFFRDKPGITIKIIDIHPKGLDVQKLNEDKQAYENCRTGLSIKSGFAPGRDEAALVYRFIKAHKDVEFLPDVIYFRIVRNNKISYIKFRMALDILIELGIVVFTKPKNNTVFININPENRKNPLENSIILRSLKSASCHCKEK